MRGWYILSFVFLCINCRFVFAQPLSDDKVDSVAKRAVKLFKVPGLAIGIVKDGKLIYSKGFGVTSIKTKKQVDAKTLFGIASNTKAFTAAALGILVDDGKLNWDDKVIKYIPDFKLYDAYATKEMTIRDLLCHHSGLATGAGDLMHDPDSTDFTVNEIIHNLRYIKPAYSFRSKFAYDNNLYLVAGEVIARISKTPWEEFIEKRILGPLHMDLSSASYFARKDDSDIIDPHKILNDTIKVVTRYTSTKDDAAGGIYSNVQDMSKWLLMLMNHGKYGDNLDQTLLTEATVKELLTPQQLIPFGSGGAYDTHFAAYGLGWFMLDAKGHKQIFHTGEDVGMVSEMSMIPELNLGIIVLTNNESNAEEAIADQITDSYLGVKGIDRSAEELKRLKRFELNNLIITQELKKILNQATPVSQGLISNYIGVYRDTWFGDVNITLQNKRLWFAAKRSPQLKGVMQFYGKNIFYIKWQNPEIDGGILVEFDKNGNKFRIKNTTPGAGYIDDLLFVKKFR